MIVRTLLFIIFFTQALFGNNNYLVKNLNYFTNYEEAIKYSIDKYQPIMMVVYEHTSLWSKKFENQVLKNDSVNEIIQIGFTPLLINQTKDSYPKDRFVLQTIPSTFFIDPLQQDPVHSVSGYMNKKEFQKTLLMVKNLFYERGFND